MKVHELRAEHLLGRRVRDADGRPLGRLHDIRFEKRGEDYVVTSYLIGAAGWFERMGLVKIGMRARGYRARWDQLDLSRPERPTLLCPRSQLEPLRPRARARGGSRRWTR